MAEILAVIVTHNRLKLLKDCIASIAIQTFPCDLLVVDNASSDGTDRAMREAAEQKELLYLPAGANLGGAGGFALGMRYAAEHAFHCNANKYHEMLNDDL